MTPSNGMILNSTFRPSTAAIWRVFSTSQPVGSLPFAGSMMAGGYVAPATIRVPFLAMESGTIAASLSTLAVRVEAAPLFVEPELPQAEEHTSELQSRPHLVCRL